jgi:phosphatidylglycerol:prolipoprotein diacylglycerol transferase
MRPILFELGPFSAWALVPIALIMATFLGLWTWLERQEEPERPLTRADQVLWLVGVALSSLAVWALINFYAHALHHPVYVRSYGAMLLVSLVAGMFWLGHSGRADGFKPTVVVDFALYALVGGILGARIIFVLLDTATFAHDPLSALRVWEGGLSFHGGVVGGVIGLYLFSRAHHMPMGRLLDLAAPCTAIGYAITRIGCFLNGCCFGVACPNFLGVRFAPGSEAAAWALHLPPGQVATTSGPPLYPTQLFSSFLGFVIFFLLVWFGPRFRKPGHVFVFFLVLSGVERFVVEFWRYGASGKPFAPLPALTEAQAFSLLLILGAGLYLIFTRPRPQAEAPAPARKGGKHQ